LLIMVDDTAFDRLHWLWWQCLGGDKALPGGGGGSAVEAASSSSLSAAAHVEYAACRCMQAALVRAVGRCVVWVLVCMGPYCGCALVLVCIGSMPYCVAPWPRVSVALVRAGSTKIPLASAAYVFGGAASVPVPQSGSLYMYMYMYMINTIITINIVNDK
jgi:hypothetical protein